MRSTDIPQADDLSMVRATVQAVAEGDTSALGQSNGLSERHMGYYLHAARVLGLIDMDPYEVTGLGRRLLATAASSTEELQILREAVAGSRALARLAPDLLAAEGPGVDVLTRRIRVLGQLAPATARRRAETLLRWRAGLLNHQGTLFSAVRSGETTPDPPDAPDAPTATSPAPASPVPETQGATLRRIQIRNYGPLQEVSAEIRPFQVVIGANATGKSTFFDALGFLADALNSNVEDAWRRRARDFSDLLWLGRGSSFAFAVEIVLSTPDPLLQVARYELEIGELADGMVGIRHEALFLIPAEHHPEPVRHDKVPKRSWKTVLTQSDVKTAFFHAELGSWKTVFQLPPNLLALAHVQESTERFPTALQVRDFLRRGVVVLAISVEALRRPCSPRLGPRLRPNGENLPLVIDALKAGSPRRYERWMAQLREALPEIREVRIVEDKEDKGRYLKLKYRNGHQVPAWRLSDGTLRVLALTLLGYLDEDAIWLIEEPENGVHPQAIEAVYEALSASPKAQVMIATHSPVFLGIAPPAALLCFSHDGEKTRVLSGDQHPALVSWHGEVDLATLFASGVLG